MNHGFTEEEEKRYVEALNYIATEATFSNVNSVKGSIELYKHFSHLQTIAAKIHQHVLEVKAVHIPEKKGKAKK